MRNGSAAWVEAMLVRAMLNCGFVQQVGSWGVQSVAQAAGSHSHPNAVERSVRGGAAKVGLSPIEKCDDGGSPLLTITQKD